MLVRSIALLAGVNRPMCRWMRRTAGALLVAMLTVVMVQVVVRYVLGSSISWAEEVSKSFMVWGAFLVAPWAYRHGANVSIDFLRQGFSPRFRAFVDITLHIVVLWLLGRLFWESLYFVDRGWTITAASLPIHMAWVYMITPFALGAMLLVGVELGLRQCVILLDPNVSLPSLGTTEEAL